MNAAWKALVCRGCHRYFNPETGYLLSGMEKVFIENVDGHDDCRNCVEEIERDFENTRGSKYATNSDSPPAS